MSRKDDLLDAAERCLYERGYARTTARDVATAAGASLAAIGYHYGSMEALMSAALIRATEHWGEELEAALADGDGGRRGSGGGSPERLRHSWETVLALFETSRPLWVSSIEAVGQIDRDPALREALRAVQHEAHLGLAASFAGLGDDADPPMRERVGALCQAMLVGVASQWLIDPAQAPGPEDLVTALRELAAL